MKYACDKNIIMLQFRIIKCYPIMEKKKSAKTATKSQRKVKQSTVDHPDSSTGISKAIPVLKVLTLKGLDSKTQCRYKISPSMVKEKGHSPFYRNVH